MSKAKIGTQAFLYPMPMAVIGAHVKGKTNYLAAAWLTRVNFNPPMIGVALGKIHFTNQGIREHREFSVNIPNLDGMAAADYVGLVSGMKTDKSWLYKPFYGELPHAPMIESCPLTMECRVTQIVDLPSNEFVIGEIINAYCDESCLTDGKPDIAKMRPFVLTMPDNRYWAIGEMVGKAWSVGRKVHKE
ncbi:MAG TPA: flavin reductase family protein [Dissulfurispiraceae bacterium]|nr:flavin reductase family protein [Dissulfurispiraceae bacterium]